MSTCTLCGAKLSPFSSRPHLYVTVQGPLVFCSDACALSYDMLTDAGRAQIARINAEHQLALQVRNEKNRAKATSVAG